jgi:nucleoside-diphosphate-sugar epimerase
MKTLITGASGFIGSYLRDAWTSDGVTVVTLSRNGDPDAALKGVERVVHLAGRVHRPDKHIEQRQRDDDAIAAFTDRLLTASAAAGVGVFVFVSSVAVYGVDREVPVSEATPVTPVTPYAKHKLAMEALVTRRAEQLGMRAVIIRPPMVYGPGMKGNPLRLFHAVDRGMPLPLGAINNRRSAIFVGNLLAAIDAVSAVGDHPLVDTLVVSDLDDQSSASLARLVGTAMDRPARIVRVPLGFLRVIRALSVGLPFRGWVDRLTGSLRLDCSKIVRTYGYRPRFSVPEGLLITARWMRDRR